MSQRGVCVTAWYDDDRLCACVNLCGVGVMVKEDKCLCVVACVSVCVCE